ncbi:hypothetical protein ACFV8T_35035 [Streptomyces sp. NPDC059832]|uniref:hypothetical protein n=1 Tax=unclassified Streptomyces TaxID=2593676 RepID=UPI0036501A1A
MTTVPEHSLHLLVLSGWDGVPEAALALGFEVSFIGDTTEFSAQDREILTRCRFVHETPADQTAAVPAAGRRIHEAEPLHAAVSFGEFGTESSAVVADALGIRGHSLDTGPGRRRAPGVPRAPGARAHSGRPALPRARPYTARCPLGAVRSCSNRTAGPDFLVLSCLRTDHEGGAGTYYADARDVCRPLAPSTLEIPRSPLLRTNAPGSCVREAAGRAVRCSPPRPR